MLAISGHGFNALVDPVHGALLHALTWQHPARGEMALLHGPGDGPDEWPQKTLWFGLWPMLPFANRAFGGVLRTGSETFDLPRNAADGLSTIHGFGWQDRWSVLAHATDAVTLCHERTEGPDPYRYRATMTIQIEPDAVCVELALANRAARPLPYGMGLHPWFPREPGATLRLGATRIMALGDDFRPTGIAPLPADPDLGGGSPLPTDRVIAVNPIDWRGEAVLTLPASSLAIGIDASDNWRCPVIWAPEGASFICVEPQSHAVGAPSEPLAHAATPMTMLSPGESLAGWMRIRPIAI